MDPLLAFEAEIDAALRESALHSPATNESESGLGTGRALTSLVDQLSRLGGDPLSTTDQQHTFALALRQVDAQGRPINPRQLNKPDISYVADTGDGGTRRVNIEIETQNLNRHVNQVNRDPTAHNVFLKIDPWTGAILGGLERAPGATTMRTLTADQAQAAVGQLPKPQRDPTLGVHPRTGAQVRNTPRPRAATRGATARTTAARTTGSTRPAATARTARPRATGRRARESEWEATIDRAASEFET
jgi:hypothetical protein